MQTNEQLHMNTTTEVFLSVLEDSDKTMKEIVDILDYSQHGNWRREFIKDDLHQIKVPAPGLPPPCKLYTQYRRIQTSGDLEGVASLTLDFDTVAYKRRYRKKIGEMVAKSESATWSSSEDNRQFLSHIPVLP